jgi:hypothetical protein
MIITTFDLMQKSNFVDLIIKISFDLLFWSHGIQPPDPESINALNSLMQSDSIKCFEINFLKIQE